MPSPLLESGWNIEHLPSVEYYYTFLTSRIALAVHHSSVTTTLAALVFLQISFRTVQFSCQPSHKCLRHVCPYILSYLILSVWNSFEEFICLAAWKMPVFLCVMRINEELLLTCHFCWVVSMEGDCYCLSSPLWTSAFRTRKSWQHALRPQRGESHNSSSPEMIPLREDGGPRAQCWGKTLLQGISRGL